MVHCRVPSGGYSGVNNVNVTLEPHPDGAGYRNRVGHSKRGADAEGAAENSLSDSGGDLVKVNDVGLQLVYCHLPRTKFFGVVGGVVSGCGQGRKRGVIRPMSSTN